MEQESKKDREEEGTETAGIEDGPKDFGYSIPGDGPDKAGPDQPQKIEDEPKDFGYSITSE